MRSNKDGKAMIFVIIAMAVMTVFSLSILLVSSSLMHNASGSMSSEQCRVMAVSLSKKITDELQRVKPRNPNEENSYHNTLWYYLKSNIDPNIDPNPSADASITPIWPYYNEDERGHTADRAYKEFTVSSNSFSDDLAKDLVGDCNVVMYWESDRDTTNISGSYFYIVVTCKAGNEKCTITNEYSMDCDILRYKNNPEDEEEPEKNYRQWTWTLNRRE